jgi:hypothetical protein
MRRSTAWVASACVAVAAAACAAPPNAGGDGSVPAPTQTSASIDRVPRDARIAESSGLALSGRDPEVLLTHNDSDDGPFVFRIGPNGDAWGRIELVGAPARDWEGMARIGSGDDARLFVGDIGDNRSSWPSIAVIEAAEPPGRSLSTTSARVYRFVYPDGPRDAESLLVSPRTGRVVVVSKRIGDAALYRAPEGLRTDGVNRLERWRDAPDLVTDGAYAPDGLRYALRGYTRAYIYDAASGKRLAVIPLPLQPQGESLTWTEDGSALLIGSEGIGTEIVRVPVPG